MPHEIVIVSGLDRAGKSTVGRLLSDSDEHLFECGGFVKNKIKTKPISKEYVSVFYERNEERLNTELITSMRFRMEALTNKQCLVVVGVRSIKLLNAIYEITPSVYVIFVKCAFGERYNRCISDRNAQVQCSRKEFMKNDQLQYGWGIEEIDLRADFLIMNDGDIESLISATRKIKAIAC